MTPERYRQVKGIFEKAIDLPSDQRSSFVDSECGTDQDLRAEVESLLAAHENEKSRIIDKAAAELLLDLGTGEQPDAAGRRIGAYRIERLLGEGGMGAVYEASRDDEQFSQRVALKLVKAAAYSEATLRRFRLERQILATLTHPHIARLLDGGITAEGQPFFVMEYVDGQPIDKYCAVKKLGIRARLALFRDVCAAVQYAHQNLIVHRDLKPSNILVTADGQVKLLDFGIAKLLREGDAAEGPVTMTGMLLMTPEYASPEQVRGTNVTTATDVYSLGIVLYELLAGTRPFHFKDRLVGEMERIICEEEPTRPSMAAGQTGTSTVGDTKPERLRRALAGDLDNIVLLAIRKEPARRYLSAEAFGEDVRRYLEGEPVAAHPTTFAYRSVKFVRRYRTAVAAACLLVLSLTGGIVATWRQKVKADDEAAKAKAVSDFLQNDLLAQASASTQANPNTKPDPDLKVRTALDRAAARIGGKFDKQPLVEAAIRQTIGSTYTDLGLYREAYRQVDRALELRRRMRGPDDAEALSSLHLLAGLEWKQGKYPRAEELYRQVLAVQQRLLGSEHTDTLTMMNDLGLLYSEEGKYALAEPLFTRALEVRRRIYGSEHPETLVLMNNLGQLYGKQGKFAQAEALLTPALEVRRRLFGAEHPETLVLMNNLAGVSYALGHYSEAEPTFAEILGVYSRTLGLEHPSTMVVMSNLGHLYQVQGKYGQAERLIVRALEIKTRVLGSEHPETLVTMSNLASLYRDQGKYVDAEPLFTKVLAARRRVLGPEHPDTLTTMNELALLCDGQQKYAQAESLLLRVLDVRQRTLPQEHPDTATTRSFIGRLYLHQEKYAKAEPLFVRVVASRRRVLGAESPATLAGIGDLATVYVKQGKYSNAEPLLREALNSYQKINAQTWLRYYSQSLLGASLAGQSKYADAEPLLLAGYEGMHQQESTIPFSRRPEVGQAADRVIQLYQAWGKPDKTVEWKKKLQATKAAPPVQ